ncbi:divalent-cation tolerance protein CutA [Orrella sp. JC864]|uniref:divalent-cation tolerance protein CutA n=1 Tax=Orrella sp. JC864 TaxID=3120298 RepID=UPI0012BBCB6D
MTQEDQVVLLFSNAPDLLLAKRIAHVLVEEGLAACVNLGAPMLSIYGWKGQVQADSEIPMWIKTTAGRCEAAIETLARLHPYEVPEAIAVPVSQGLPAYLDWVRAQAQGPLHGPESDQ